MCGACARVWERPSYGKAVADLSGEALQRVIDLWWIHADAHGSGNLRAVEALRREKIPALREWDSALFFEALARAEDVGLSPTMPSELVKYRSSYKRRRELRDEPAIWGGSMARLAELTTPTYPTEEPE